MKKNPKKPPAKKAEQNRAPENEVLFLRGRHARKSGIRREDSPHLGAEAKVWLEGWDYEDEAQGG